MENVWFIFGLWFGCQVVYFIICIIVALRTKATRRVDLEEAAKERGAD